VEQFFLVIIHERDLKGGKKLQSRLRSWTYEL